MAEQAIIRLIKATPPVVTKFIDGRVEIHTFDEDGSPLVIHPGPTLPMSDDARAKLVELLSAGTTN